LEYYNPSEKIYTKFLYPKNLLRSNPSANPNADTQVAWWE